MGRSAQNRARKDKRIRRRQQAVEELLSPQDYEFWMAAVDALLRERAGIIAAQNVTPGSERPEARATRRPCLGTVTSPSPNAS